MLPAFPAHNPLPTHHVHQTVDQVRVEFVGFLRPQIKFDSAQDLIDELKRNV